MGAPTYFGSASDPTDNGSGAEPRTSTITPPGSMVAGDLVVVVIHDGLTTAPDSSVLTTGGQSWSARVDGTGANNVDFQMFWCQFNGTWGTNPQFTIAAHSGTIPVTVVMHVFRPDAAGTWAVDQAFTMASEASASPVVITGVTNTRKDTVTLAGCGIRASVATWGSVSGSGWAAAGTAQYRNTNGTDNTCTFAYRVSAASGASGDVSITPSAAAAGASFIASWYNSRTPPTIALNTADAHDFGSDTTPTVEFTGTDGNADDVRYQVQIDTVSTFDSLPSSPLELDSYSESNNDTPAQVFAGQSGESQSFLSGAGGKLVSAKFYLSKTGAPTGNVVAKLYAHSGTFGTSSVPTGAALATSDNLDIATLTTSLVLTTLTFTGAQQVTLSAATNYCIAIEYSGGDASNRLNVGRDISSPTHAGNEAQFSGSWTANAGRDLPFYVYIASPLLSKLSSTDAGFLNTVSGADVVVDSYSETNRDSDATLQGGTVASAQAFTGLLGNLHSARFYLSKVGSPTGDMLAKLYAHSGTFGTSSVPTGSPLATSSAVAASTLTGSPTLITFTFPVDEQYALVAAVKYVIVIEHTVGDAGNHVLVGVDSTGGHAGNWSYYNGSWNPDSSYDMPFYVYSGDTDPFNSGEKVGYTVQAGDALADGTYHWRARANDVNGGNTWSAWATTRTFTVNSGPQNSLAALPPIQVMTPFLVR